jgi:integrase
MQVTPPATLTEAVARYLEIRKAKVSGNTYKGDEVGLRWMCSLLGENRVLDEITRELCDTALFGPGGLRARVSGTSFNHYLSKWRRFTATAESYDWIDRDPLRAVTGVARETNPDRQRLTAAQLLDLIEVAKSPRDRIAAALAVNTGLRASEIVSLRLRDVNLAAGYIAVRIIKTKDADRVPITSELDTELRRWLAHYVEHLGHLSPDWFLVPSQNYAPRSGGPSPHDYKLIPHKAPSAPEAIIKRLLESMGLDTHKEGFHTVRRSVGRLYYEFMKSEHGSERALFLTSVFLHHADTAMTRHYIGVNEEREERDATLRGRSFLPTMLPTRANVRRLHYTA